MTNQNLLTPLFLQLHVLAKIPLAEHAKCQDRIAHAYIDELFPEEATLPLWKPGRNRRGWTLLEHNNYGKRILLFKV
ncbi:hypothetical protein ASPZODRAFT_127209 [Penicilliopsis zonata CBS 506.65]|uniref:Uncharacterized protein n=1 Tax=Penicilliopsis zonata CBS 506.65 TaxID=1073090 RepID=A0A1L9SVC3_9EURO|nr:hypothetical protein ASPZODRAFT_127209 [Penicilliopsis zonata CBS 506.65]OJJ51182.1 hypothetical protein ASPZODRAFT_127209 [Penicilliopsis zonata CBS 506.65]